MHTVRNSMITIFLICHPFKIIRMIVQFIAIDMIYLRLIFRIRNICICNKSVYKLQVPSDTYTQITFTINLWFYDPVVMLVCNCSVF